MIVPADIYLSQLLGELPERYVACLAQEKAAACLNKLATRAREHPILAADTTVAINGKVLGKPEDDEDARDMLQALSGRVHQVHTAVALAYAGTIEAVLSTTIVEMMPLPLHKLHITWPQTNIVIKPAVMVFRVGSAHGLPALKAVIPA